MGPHGAQYSNILAILREFGANTQYQSLESFKTILWAVLRPGGEKRVFLDCSILHMLPHCAGSGQAALSRRTSYVYWAIATFVAAASTIQTSYTWCARTGATADWGVGGVEMPAPNLP